MKPEAHQDFVDAVQCLNDEACDFVVVGAHALAVHGSPRATGDLDILVGALGHVQVRCIGLEALLKNKRATGRTKDLADVEALEALRRG